MPSLTRPLAEFLSGMSRMRSLHLTQRVKKSAGRQRTPVLSISALIVCLKLAPTSMMMYLSGGGVASDDEGSGEEEEFEEGDETNDERMAAARFDSERRLQAQRSAAAAEEEDGEYPDEARLGFTPVAGSGRPRARP